MTPTEQGRFCNSCQKTVFDFTNATDTEIVKHIEKMKGNIFCGQFEEGQLNRWMEKSNLETSNPSLYKYLFSFIMLVAGQKVSAQQVAIKKENGLQISMADSVMMKQALKMEMPDKGCLTGRSQSVAKLGKPTVIRLGQVRALSTTNGPIYIVDGKIVDSTKMKDFNADNIETLDVLQSAQASAMYGSVGVNGAIIITTKALAKKSSKIKRGK